MAPVLLVAVLGCEVGSTGGGAPDDVSVRRSKLTEWSYKTHLVLPIYFGPTDPAWGTIFNSLYNDYQAGKQHSLIAIVTGSNSGAPPPASSGNWDAALFNDIVGLQGYNTLVLGYVDLATQYYIDSHGLHNAPLTEQQVYDQIATWYSDYGVDGIFFDAAERHTGHDYTDQDLAMVMRIADNVANYSNNGFYFRMMFNWGNTYAEMQRYVDCLMTNTYTGSTWYPWDYFQFVAHETTQAMYSPDPAGSWIYNYRPTHFSTIINTVTNDFPISGTFYESIIPGNSTGASFTELTNYNGLPGSADTSNPGYIWGCDLSFDNVATSNYGGQDIDNPTSTCPSE